MPQYATFTVGLVIFLFLFFGVFLFLYRKGNPLSKHLLGIFFLTLGLNVADVYFQVDGTYQSHPQYAYFISGLSLVYAPLLWLFTKSVVEQGKQLRNKDYVHFLPFGIVMIGLVFLFHIQDMTYKQEFVRRATEDPGEIATVISFLIFGFIGWYVLRSFGYLRRYRKRLREEVSNVEAINLGWLELTLYGFAGIHAMMFFVQVGNLVWTQEILHYVLFVSLIGMLSFIMSVIVRGLTSDVSFSFSLEETAAPTQQEAVDDRQLHQLNTWMETERPFLQASLSLKELASQLTLSPRELSTLINRGSGLSFFDFVNGYRIRFAQDLLQNPTDEKQTILEVMYASGFNSKSSFNTAFKKHVGMTPSQWRSVGTTHLANSQAEVPPSK